MNQLSFAPGVLYPDLTVILYLLLTTNRNQLSFAPGVLYLDLTATLNLLLTTNMNQLSFAPSVLDFDLNNCSSKVVQQNKLASANKSLIIKKN
jgi:hypothetical protein